MGYRLELLGISESLLVQYIDHAYALRPKLTPDHYRRLANQILRKNYPTNAQKRDRGEYDQVQPVFQRHFGRSTTGYSRVHGGPSEQPYVGFRRL